MKIDFDKLDRFAAEESKAERKIAEDFRENRDLYKASFRIAMKLKRALRLRGMTQAQLAGIMGVDRAVISRYMSGKANLELKTIVKLEKVLNINIIDREISGHNTKVIVLNDYFKDSKRFEKTDAHEFNVLRINTRPVYRFDSRYDRDKVFDYACSLSE